MKQRLVSVVLGLVILSAVAYAATETLTVTANPAGKLPSDRDAGGPCGSTASRELQPAPTRGFGCTCIRVRCIEGVNCCGDLVHPNKCGSRGEGDCDELNCAGICCKPGTGG